MKAFIKAVLVIATLFTPAAYVIVPAVVVCLVSDLAAFVVKTSVPV